MKKFAQAASILALTAASVSASAWWGAAPTCMTEEQKQAMADQQRVMAEQQAKAMENAMTAQRQFVEQQAVAAKRYTELAPTINPLAANPFSYQGPMDQFPAMPEMSMPEMPAMPEFPSMPEMAYPGMPQMPEFPAIPEMAYPGMPQMPAMPEMAMPQLPEMPASYNRPFGRPTPPSYITDRQEQMKAYRAKARQESEARREAMKQAAEHRRALRFGPGRYVVPQLTSFTRPMPMPQFAPTTEPAPAVEVPVAQPAPQVQAAAPVAAPATPPTPVAN